ncbi:olfactory receptor 14A16-like [Perognathus longimembris pacificus]|uniref:olfactory receptor 14A16-like n=1 Tax=Perognathus longimembris pacificus TaxID=214514 RepID=UPI00201A13DD|nr:olfactory receptor 14A16-like [Perognathus longimembris pacificus]
MDNSTSGSTFFLTGFSTVPELQIFHALVFSAIYLAAVLGNLLIIILTTQDHRLHTPMYFFLKNLSFLDLCLISITVPKSITNSLLNNNTISYCGCVSQVLFFFLLATTEVSLLTVMSYDRYVAICHPLRYEILISHRACVQMAASSWVSGGFNAVLHTAATFSVPMCGSLYVNQFFCDVPQLLSLSCSYNIGEFVVIGFSLVLDFGCFVFIDISYVHIFIAVLNMPSKEGRAKAFSTCLPHLMVVTLFLSSGFFAYLRPLPKSPSTFDLIISVFYTVVPPTMNPLIYSLRNKDMKRALRRLKVTAVF